ncbi:MAG: hypothetical protein ACKVRN_04720 [Pyrinomonadaceae bacterium]
MQPKSDFKTIVESVLKKKFLNGSLSRVCQQDDPVSARVFADYGAIFIADGITLPNRCIFETERLVQRFQSQAEPYEMTIGGVRVVLQRAAMTAFEAAYDEAEKRGLKITPRGGSAASTRSYTKTVELWQSRFNPGLNHWTKKGKISARDAAVARAVPIAEQVKMVLEWEKKGIYFSQDRSKSILYSVAVPGASQHVFMLALDVEQFGNKKVREILAKHGWFQTVKSDLPHFTFLGRKESELPQLGLKREQFGDHIFWIPNM